MLETGTVRTNSGSVHGYSAVNAFGGMQLTRVWHFVHKILDIDVPKLSVVRFSDEIFRQGAFPYTSLNLQVGLDAIKNRLVIKENPDPRVYLAGSYTPTLNWQEGLSLMSNRHPFHQSPLAEKALPLNTQALSQGIGTVEITAFSQSEVRLMVDTPSKALLVLAEAWYPGWNVKIGQEEQESFPVNVWMRGAIVPAGRHEVIFFYDSNYLGLGLGISIVTLLGLYFVWRRSRAA